MDWRPCLGGDWRVGLDWIILGGASGPDYQSQMMNRTWLEDTVKQCRDANMPLFVEQDSSNRAGQQGASRTSCGSGNSE